MTADDRTADDSAEPHTDILVVVSAPPGWPSPPQLQAFGARFRLIDRQLDRVHESRALAIQPRTLEVLAAFGIATPW
jgi:2-polyprenyl-6-methoxyphenol hydroxylase-like FAD-dependent oxidoreductase